MTVSQRRHGIPGPARGVTAAQWALLQAILASDGDKTFVLQVDSTGAVLIKQADGDTVFSINTSGPLIRVRGADFIVNSDFAGSVEKFRVRAASGHLLTSGVSPGIAPGANAGSTGAAALAGTDVSGRILITPGGTGIAAGDYATVTFANPYASTNYGVLLFANDADAAAAGDNVYVDDASQTTSTFKIRSDIGLTSGNQYIWKYLVIEYEP